MGPRLGGGDDVEPELVAARRHVRLRRVPRAPGDVRAAGWSKERVREAMFAAVARPARELQRGETTPVGPPPIPTRRQEVDSPEEIVLLAAGGEAGRYSALLGPCLGMDAAIVSREIVE